MFTQATLRTYPFVLERFISGMKYSDWPLGDNFQLRVIPAKHSETQRCYLQAKRNTVDQLDENYAKLIQQGEDVKREVQTFVDNQPMDRDLKRFPVLLLNIVRGVATCTIYIHTYTDIVCTSSKLKMTKKNKTKIGVSLIKSR